MLGLDELYLISHYARIKICLSGLDQTRLNTRLTSPVEPMSIRPRRLHGLCTVGLIEIASPSFLVTLIVISWFIG